MLSLQGKGNLIDRGDVYALHDGLWGDVAEEGDLPQDVTAEAMLGTQDEDVGLDTYLLELLDRVLGRLGLDLSGRSDVGDVG